MATSAASAGAVSAVLGMGGVGKTALVVTAVQSAAAHFDIVIWRSLLNAPPFEQLLRPIVQTLAGSLVIELPASLDEQLALLLDELRRQRCLLILDNLESVLHTDGLGRGADLGARERRDRPWPAAGRSAVALLAAPLPPGRGPALAGGLPGDC